MQHYVTDEKYLRKNRKEPPGKNFITIILIALVINFAGDIIMGLPTVYLSRIISDGGWRFVTDAYLPFLGTFILILIYLKIFDPQLYQTVLPASSGGMKGNTVKGILLGLLFGAAINGFCALAAMLHGDLKFSVGHFDVIYMIVAFILVAIQSSTEELVFRCYVFQAVTRRHGLILGITANSVFFALMHGANPGIGIFPILDLLLWSVFCSLVVYYFDGFWFVCMVHTAWNYTQNFLLGLPNSGLVSERSFLHLDAASGSIFYNFAFGVEGGLTSILEMVIFCILIMLWVRRKKEPAE